jgi:hypothetical protein
METGMTFADLNCESVAVVIPRKGVTDDETAPNFMYGYTAPARKKRVEPPHSNKHAWKMVRESVISQFKKADQPIHKLIAESLQRSADNRIYISPSLMTTLLGRNNAVRDKAAVLSEEEYDAIYSEVMETVSEAMESLKKAVA